VWQTDRQTDRRTEFSSLDRVSILYRAVTKLSSVGDWPMSHLNLVWFGPVTSENKKPVRS